MHVATSIERTIRADFAHRIFFTRGAFSPTNRLLAELLAGREGRECAKALVVLDDSVARAFPKIVADIVSYFSGCSCRLVGEPLLLAGGEAAKNGPHVVDELHAQVARHGIDRHSYLIAIGGGALLDAAGFAAATAHRGVRHLRLPSTSLSQADGGVGVKNGINAFGKKNFIGTFAPPFAVINDADFLATLPEAEKRAGLIEAVKVALIRDATFFGLIESHRMSLARLETSVLEQTVRRCAELHVEHIASGGDPFELGSARPLDFGHWSAHKLEQLSDFTVSHGAAVACGVSLDVLYSQRAGLLDAGEAARILTLIEDLGFALFHPLMESDGGESLLAGLEDFREHLGGRLTITLLRGIGRGEEVHEIDPKLMRASLRELRDRPSPNRVS